jgi:putative flippase GtrA
VTEETTAQATPSRDGWRRRIGRGVVFLFVGGVGFLVDAGVFNALVYWGGSGPLFEQPLVAKIIAILVATVVTFYGNAWLTYRDRSARMTARRFTLYEGLNVAAILLQLACLGFSRYVLGLADPVADNISGTLIGQALATVFRYVSYNVWVFPHDRKESVEHAVGDIR